MDKEITKLNASELVGPRSFFTDIDPHDPTYDQQTVLLKLKLQFLTKDRVLIAASSLFTDTGYSLFSQDEGLIAALEQGVVVPTIRSEFDDPSDFFNRYGYGTYSSQTRNFFVDHTTHSLPWDLKQNSSWFKDTFYQHLIDNNSLLRQKTLMTETMARDFLGLLDREIQNSKDEHKYLRREHIYSVGKKFGEDIGLYVANYANLLYRISGSRVVNAEGHFPQSNLTKLGIAGNDAIISDESIFWDIYIEGVIAFLSSAIKLTPERIQGLSVFDILKIRQRLLNIHFSREYDNLIKKAKETIDIHDPEKLVLKQTEINSAVLSMRTVFANRILDEIQIKDSKEQEDSLWQLADVLALVSTPSLGLIIGVLSSLNSIPEITTLFSKSTAESIRQRYEWVRHFLNNKVGWTKEQRQVLLDGYKELIVYGLPLQIDNK